MYNKKNQNNFYFLIISQKLLNKKQQLKTL